jgi:hypothetical protein
MSNERNIEVFSVALDKALEAARENANQVKRTVALDLLSRIVDRTPVDTGRARANWQVSLSSPRLSEASYTNSEKIPQGNQESAIAGRAKAKGAAIVKNAQEGQDIWITNNLPYINRLETGTWSDQAPQGMVAISIAEVQQAITLRRDL